MNVCGKTLPLRGKRRLTPTDLKDAEANLFNRPDITLRDLEEISIEDLLGRQSVAILMGPIFCYTGREDDSNETDNPQEWGVTRSYHDDSESICGFV